MILDRFRVDDRVAIVTGAGRGIGRGSALALAEAGADVVISSRTAEQLDEVVAEVEKLGRRAVAVPADLMDTASLAALADRAVEEFGRIDIVVNNVGGTMPNMFMTTTEEFFEEAFHFNVSTAFALTKAAVPHLVKHGGSVVNISSAMGRFADRGYVAYGTAKAGLAHFTRLAARDLAPRIRVNALAVGSVRTSALDIVAANDDIREELETKTPLKRLGQVEDIAAAVLWLASDAGSFMTGKVIEIDGGLQEPNLSFNLPDIEPED